MKIEPQDFFRLTEKAKTLCCFDLESTGFRGDYNSILVGCVKPYGVAPTTFRITQPGNDQRLVREIKEELEKYDCWVTFYGKGFDIKMLDTRLLRWGYAPVDKRPHVDMYFSLKTHLNLARGGQGHAIRFLGLAQDKLEVTPEMWNEVVGSPNGRAMQTLIARCKSDVGGLEELYDATKHLIRDVKR